MKDFKHLREDIIRLDELSSATLRRYRKKASDDVKSKKKTVKLLKAKSHSGAKSVINKKINNRLKNIGLASVKTTPATKKTVNSTKKTVKVAKKPVKAVVNNKKAKPIKTNSDKIPPVAIKASPDKTEPASKIDYVPKKELDKTLKPKVKKGSLRNAASSAGKFVLNAAKRMLSSKPKAEPPKSSEPTKTVSRTKTAKPEKTYRRVSSLSDVIGSSPPRRRGAAPAPRIKRDKRGRGPRKNKI